MRVQRVTKTCDVCGKTAVFPVQGVPEPCPDELQDWFAIHREIVVDGQWSHIGGDACSPACGDALMVKLLAVVPLQSEPDLSGLAVN